MGGFCRVNDSIEPEALRAEGEGFEFARPGGEYVVSSLMKQKKKGKICFVIHIAGFFFLKFFCYEVFAKQKKPELADNYYSLGGPASRRGVRPNRGDRVASVLHGLAA